MSNIVLKLSEILTNSTKCGVNSKYVIGNRSGAVELKVWLAVEHSSNNTLTVVGNERKNNHGAQIKNRYIHEGCQSKNTNNASVTMQH